MVEGLTLYKLIVLYMLDHVTFPMTNSQISEFVVGQQYTSWFHIQEALSEMTESGLLEKDTERNTSYYLMTEEGQSTIRYLENQIPEAIRQDVITYLKAHSYELMNQVACRSDYEKSPNGRDYLVHCRVSEADNLVLDLTLSVPEESLAADFVLKWKERSQSIYKSVMEEFMK